MSYVYNGMGDHIRVGPQFQVPRTRGVQVVRRGPHGKPIAPPLAMDPQGKAWGQELRWWGDYPIPTLSVPQQHVVGVSGMGATVESVMTCPPNAPPFDGSQLQLARHPQGSREWATWIELMKIVGAACRGRVDEASRLVNSSQFAFIRNQVPAENQWKVAADIGQVQSYIQLARTGAGSRLREQERREGTINPNAPCEWNTLKPLDSLSCFVKANAGYVAMGIGAMIFLGPFLASFGAGLGKSSGTQLGGKL